jgi:hypothetical protein
VRWIGGPPDSGKTTVASMIAERYGLPWYRMDQYETDHIARADPERHPLHVALREKIADGEASFFESWVQNDARTLAAQAMAVWIERLDLIRDDLRRMDSAKICIAEGPGFFPEAIAPLLSDPGHAIWLVASKKFKRESYARREKSAWRSMTTDPDLAMKHHIDRDLIMAETYRRQLVAMALSWIEVDGSESPEAIADRVANRFGLNRSAG